MDNMWNGIVTIALAIVGIAILAVIVSRNAQTPQVIQAATGGFAQDISAATSPVTGSSSSFGISSMGFTGGLAPGF